MSAPVNQQTSIIIIGNRGPAAPEKKFYIEKPIGINWSVMFSEAIIEGRECSDPDLSRSVIEVLAPNDFRWSTILQERLVRCDGPARMLSREEYIKCFQRIHPEIPPPKNLLDYVKKDPDLPVKTQKSLQKCLDWLRENHPITANALQENCNNPRIGFSERSIEILQQLDFIDENGRLRGVVHSFILSTTPPQNGSYSVS